MRISRRSLLRVAPLGVATTLLAACSPTPTAPPPTAVPVPSPTSIPTVAAKPTAAPAPTATVTTAAQPTTVAKSSALPSYMPLANKPKADYPSKGDLYEDGYVNFPGSP